MKKRRYDGNTHKAMRVPVDIHERKKKFTVTVQQKNVCKFEFSDHL